MHDSSLNILRLDRHRHRPRCRRVHRQVGGLSRNRRVNERANGKEEGKDTKKIQKEASNLKIDASLASIRGELNRGISKRQQPA